MGWFSSDPKEDETPTSMGGTYKPMKRNERQQCWDARDLYFQCLDRNGILDPVKDEAQANAKCASENTRFEKDCAKSWVQYFKAKRVADFEKDERLKKLEAETGAPVGQEQSKWKFW